MSERTNLADLLGQSYRHVPVRERFRRAVACRGREKEDLFPNILGLELPKRRITEFMMAGRPVLLTGVYGVAKTEIAKQIVEILSEYNRRNPVYCIDDCPIQEDPMNIAKALGLSKEGGKPCPICEKRFDLQGKGTDASRIVVARMGGLSEGRGFARVQSGFDTHPEELIGTYNLAKLAEIGDPFDPQVFQPGKIGQASGGVLFVDEVGKLSEAGQYALIQAAEEGTVTPTKSRRTFPVDMLLIATTNPEDESNINGAVFDRLRSVRIDIVGRDDEIKLAQKELAKMGEGPYIPRTFLKWGVDSIRAAREHVKDIQIGPRVTLDMIAMANSSAVFDGRDIATFCDIKEGLYSAITARAKFEDMSRVESEIKDVSMNINDYLQREYRGCAERCARELSREFGEKITLGRIKSALDSSKEGFECTKEFAHELEGKEGVSGELVPKLISVYFYALTKGCPSPSDSGEESGV